MASKTKKPGVKVTFVEIVTDPKLGRKEHAAARKALRKFYPKAKCVRLYRDGRGRLGWQADLGERAGGDDRAARTHRAIVRAVNAALKSER